eukprot:763194-Hanusia_phi.AAC.3
MRGRTVLSTVTVGGTRRRPVARSARPGRPGLSGFPGPEPGAGVPGGGSDHGPIRSGVRRVGYDSMLSD